jgi:D-alanyl-D-alanine carboxypeptidase
MLAWRDEALRRLRWEAFSLVTALALVAVTSGPSDARSHRRHVNFHSSEASSDEPRYADIVVDGNSGATLHAENPDAPRHPASLTKVMTLYLLFEQLEAGKLKLDSQLDVSEHASEQSPTKLGLRAGQTIKVEDAIKGIVTRSANDAAVVVGERIGGDEETFARLMTRKAQALGMLHTLYRNASGLPNDEQVTTARDQSLLGRAIQERFPVYYRYFATRSFEFRGETIGNHNHLLGSVDGVDGIKTGYIGASGFNIITSVHRGNRFLLAVVFGGSSAGSRDERMRELISEHIAEASTQRTATLVADAGPSADIRPDAKPEPKLEAKPEAKPAAKSKPETKTAPQTYSVASASSVPVTLTSRSDPGTATTIQVPRWAPTNAMPTPRAAPAVGSADPIRPVPVKTFVVKAAGAVQTASLVPVQPPAAVPVAAPAAPQATTASPPPAPSAPPPIKTAAAIPFPPPGARPGILGTLPARMTSGTVADTMPTSALALAAVPAAPAAPANTGPTGPHNPAPAATAAAAAVTAQAHTGWIIQVGAFPAEDEAKQRLSTVQSRAARFLASADPFTEAVSKGETTLYRARFAGLGKDQAEAACNYLKHNEVDCMTIKN